MGKIEPLTTDCDVDTLATTLQTTMLGCCRHVSFQSDDIASHGGKKLIISITSLLDDVISS